MAPTYAPGTPSWVDLVTTDVASAIDFYHGLFGWTADEPEPGFGGYRNLRQGGRLVAGISPVMDPHQQVVWGMYFSTDDADTVAAAVEANGGKVLAAPMEIGEHGRMALFLDPTGASFGVWQPGTHPGAELVDAHGSLTWTELLTPDMESTTVFYPHVLPVATRQVSLGAAGDYLLLEVDGSAVAGALPAGVERPSWTIYFAVDDCDTATERAAQLGGSVLTPPMDSPAGRLATLTDPQGGAFTVIETDPDFAK